MQRGAPAAIVDVSRNGLAWREAGTEPAVPYLHGIPDSPRVWDGLIAILATRSTLAPSPWRPVHSPSSGRGTAELADRTWLPYRALTALSVCSATGGDRR